MPTPEGNIAGSSNRVRKKDPGTAPEPNRLQEAIISYHRRLKRAILVCLLITYLIPVVILTAYFHYQFNQNMRESSKLQLAAVAENQRNTADLFLQNRIINIFNIVYMKDVSLEPTPEDMQSYLDHLVASGDAFVDVGIIDPDGIQKGYAGPCDELLEKDYRAAQWYNDLVDGEESYIITDIYMGCRNEPRFTIGVKHRVNDGYYVIRTSIDPEKLERLVHADYPQAQASGFLVNREGAYQVAGPEFGELLGESGYAPAGKNRQADVATIKWNGEPMLAAHTWLKEVPWCLVMLQPEDVAFAEMYTVRNTMIIGAALLILVIMAVIWLVATHLMGRAQALDEERHELKSQLYHAHKLVSVGQLAGGVAHEINNPLAIIESESGMIRDMLDPEMGLDASPDAIRQELEEIDKAVRRARGITQKILSFVRKTDPKLEECDINRLLDDVVSGVKEQEFNVSDINLVKAYADDLPGLYLDPDLMRQVFLNLVNNASDAVEAGDTITLTTEKGDNCVKITVADTGKGMSPDQLEKIFMPFYTTKKVGKGTGLGLAISLNIVEGFGGRMEVRSTPGEGTAFTVVLPLPGSDLGREDDSKG